MRYDERIKKLQEQIKENNRKITEYNKDKDTLISCQSGTKTTLSLFYSIIPYLTLFGIISALYGSGKISIPAELSACIITGGSIAASTVCNTILTIKSRKRLKNKYTESENLEKTIRLLIEPEKLKNRNKILEATIDKLQEQQRQEEGIEAFVKQLDVQVKETVSEDSEKYANEIKKLTKELNEYYKKIDTMIAKKELDRYSKSKSTLKKTLILSGILTAYASSPILLKYAVGINESITKLQTLMTILGTFIASTFACTLYMKKQNSYLKNAVTNLENKLLYEQENEEETIENIIKKISQIESKLQEKKEILKVVEENKKTVYKYTFDASEYKMEEYGYQDCEIEKREGYQYTLRMPAKRL